MKAMVWEGGAVIVHVQNVHTHRGGALQGGDAAVSGQNLELIPEGLHTDTQFIPEGLHTHTQFIPEGLHTHTQFIPEGLHTHTAHT